jgi:hypothetical protein
VGGRASRGILENDTTREPQGNPRPGRRAIERLAIAD